MYAALGQMLANETGGQFLQKGGEFIISKEGAIEPLKEAGGVGLVVPGVNMPAGQHPDEIRRQARKFGNQVSSRGVPPTIRTDGLVEEEEVWDQPSPRKKHKILSTKQ